MSDNKKEKYAAGKLFTLDHVVICHEKGEVIKIGEVHKNKQSKGGEYLHCDFLRGFCSVNNINSRGLGKDDMLHRIFEAAKEYRSRTCKAIESKHLWVDTSLADDNYKQEAIVTPMELVNGIGKCNLVDAEDEDDEDLANEMGGLKLVDYGDECDNSNPKEVDKNLITELMTTKNKDVVDVVDKLLDLLKIKEENNVRHNAVMEDLKRKELVVDFTKQINELHDRLMVLCNKKESNHIKFNQEQESEALTMLKYFFHEREKLINAILNSSS